MTQVFKSVALAILRGYKWAISPLFGPACRYVPTCSEYAMEAVERHGAAEARPEVVLQRPVGVALGEGDLDVEAVELGVPRPGRLAARDEREQHGENA